MKKTSALEKVRATAVISDCGLYRYLLTRSWGPRDGRHVTWLMLNPSTADASVDDQTIRKCMGFARQWGFGGIQVVNLFALRSRHPAELLKAADPVGPDFDLYLRKALSTTSLLIAAWGCESTLRRSPTLSSMPNKVFARIRQVNPWLPIECLGTTPAGTPYHPLMLSYARAREPFLIDISAIEDARKARLAKTEKTVKGEKATE